MGNNGPEKRLNNNKNIIKMKLYSGILCAILGALVLILSYLLDGVDNNLIQLLGIVLVIGGIALHIFVNYKKPHYD